MSERKTDDATLIEALRILARTLTTEDGVIPACLAEVANRLETLVEERRWVPVGERLPPVQGEDVLTLSFFSDGSPLVCLGWHNGREWMQYHGRGPGLPVTNWQPLPPWMDTKEVGK